jgi:antitoxin (DNA-binding transcriptional repressor) of toxin-antitoxin stability system
MATTTVGIREFRDNLATYILEADKPIAITRHGDTVGLFIPTRRKRTEADRIALDEAASAWFSQLEAAGITEDEALEDFKRWRKEQVR